VVEYAHRKGVLVEGEIDHIQGSSSDHTKESPKSLQNIKQYTDPEEAEEFVKNTGVDTFASFVGNLHGIYAENKHLDIDLLQKIINKIPDTFLSLHGGSGIFVDDVKKAIQIIDSKYPNTHHYISTIGIKNMDTSWIKDNITLQLSLHSLDENRRNELIPFKNKMTIEELGKVRTKSNRVAS
jgi:hypothetical protein